MPAPSTGPTELLLVRHGESLANIAASAAEASGAHEIAVDRRDPDVELSPAGEEQARALGRWLADEARPASVWTSPYRRAAATARLALAEAGIDLPLRADERLRDRDLGVTDRLTTAGVRARLPEEAARRIWLGKFYYRPVGGEAWTDLALRVRAFLDHLDTAAAPGPAVVFCHDAVVLVLRYVCEGLSEHELLDIGAATPVANGSVTRLVREGEGWRLALFNSTDHLERSGAPVTRHDDRAAGQGDHYE
ncbi:histidine phosphatase family protein [Rathayibacter rathayi]|uniref:histidine phosphatase family protein n=1 Tax=Rathayibacter rathayi TaxID=33887 RepID=UPI000CE87732|nr:histidine phosphatase family protein [Rathayibacter rathayi]PPG68042.1 histidine phosphatase family protein [Rathayibacter rathayi]PPG76091.1 histidine phosphatase family protein [Rathayibacter rathayi]PPH21163.1 histidine phosphatase family protein [Rathayibacter rathayi]PPI75345.1 histidine phosphatase family protein [Rathayibacter rathayi]